MINKNNLLNFNFFSFLDIYSQILGESNIVLGFIVKEKNLEKKVENK